MNIKENSLNLSFSWEWVKWFYRNIRALPPMILSAAWTCPCSAHCCPCGSPFSYPMTPQNLSLLTEHTTSAVICRVVPGDPAVGRVVLPSPLLPILHPADPCGPGSAFLLLKPLLGLHAPLSITSSLLTSWYFSTECPPHWIRTLAYHHESSFDYE